MATGYEEFESKMKKTSELLTVSFASVRAGRANAAVLDQIQVDYYGTPTPIQQIATISTPDPRSLLIQPWDSSTLKSIEKAILASDLGINPQNDGKVIRLVFPQLTEERRKELTRVVNKMGEEIKTAIRNVRRDANEDVKKLEKDKNVHLSEDAAKKALEDIQKLTDQFVKEVEDTVKHKDAEILKV